MSRRIAIFCAVLGICVLGIAAWGYLSFPKSPKSDGQVEVTYSFVEPREETGPVSVEDNVTKVGPLKEGEWIILFGSGDATLHPLDRDLGSGDKCYVVGIEGPTQESFWMKYTSVKGNMPDDDIALYLSHPDSFAYEVDSTTESLEMMKWCNAGIDVLQISQ